MQDFSAIRSTRGVLKIIRFSSMPQPMPAGAVEALIHHEEVLQQAGTNLFQPGEKVQITDGPFAGWQGVFQTETPDQRIWILLDILGKQNALAFDRDTAVPA